MRTPADKNINEAHRQTNDPNHDEQSSNGIKPEIGRQYDFFMHTVARNGIFMIRLLSDKPLQMQKYVHLFYFSL